MSLWAVRPKTTVDITKWRYKTPVVMLVGPTYLERSLVVWYK